MPVDVKHDVKQLSNIGQKCYVKEKKETLELTKPVELSFADSKKLMGYSEGITEFLNTIKDDKTEIAKKEKAVKDLQGMHRVISAFALKHKDCFEARKVLIMCEMNMLDAGIDPKNVNADFDASAPSDEKLARTQY